MKMEMNGEKKLFISTWRKAFLTFFQRWQRLVSGQPGLTKWNDSFRKRLENVYLVSMAHRIEIRRFPWDCEVVLRLPIMFRNLLSSQTYGKSHLYVYKGITAYRDKLYDRDNSGMVGSLTSGSGGFRLDMDQIYLKRYDRAYSGWEKDSISAPGGSKTNMDQLYSDQMLKNSGKPDYHNFPDVSESSFIKPGNIHLKYKLYKRRFMERTERVSLNHIRGISAINQSTIRSLNPYKRAAMKPGQRDIMYGDMIYGDMMYGRANSGMTESLTSKHGELSTSMDKINSSHRHNYSGGTEHLNPSEAQDTIRQFIHDGLKPLQHKKLPVVPFRYESADPMHADIIYAIPPWTGPKTKMAGKRFNSDLTSDITREFSRTVSLNTINTERGKSFYEMTQNGITQTQNPILEKKETGKTGASIDYNKLADLVYEILTRRIIREKERLG